MKKKSVISNSEGKKDRHVRSRFAVCRLMEISGPHPVRAWGLLLIAALALHGCAGILPGPEDDPLARGTIADLNGRNPELAQFKGLLEIRLESAGQPSMAGRAGWAGAVPDRMRIEWLNMLGQPILSLAADGRTITLISHAEQRYRRLAQSSAALKQLIGIPVTVEDLIALMRGRPLLPDFTAARESSSGDGGRTILLKDRWYNTMAALTFSGDQLVSEQLFTPRGEARYRIEWLQWQQVDRFTIPRRILLTAPTGERLAISVVRFWPRASFGPSTFFLERPEFMDE